MALIAYSGEYNKHYPRADTDLHKARAFWLSIYKADKDPYALRCALECARAIKWCQQNGVSTAGHGAWKQSK